MAIPLQWWSMWCLWQANTYLPDCYTCAQNLNSICQNHRPHFHTLSTFFLFAICTASDGSWVGAGTESTHSVFNMNQNPAYQEPQLDSLWWQFGYTTFNYLAVGCFTDMQCLATCVAISEPLVTLSEIRCSLHHGNYSFQYPCMRVFFLISCQ